jgi:hypothetical protein
VTDAADRVTAALTDAIKAGEMGDDTLGMPGKWVLISTHYSSSGETHLAFFTDQDSNTHDTLGLLSLGTVAWTEQARRWVQDNQDGD